MEDAVIEAPAAVLGDRDRLAVEVVAVFQFLEEGVGMAADDQVDVPRLLDQLRICQGEFVVRVIADVVEGDDQVALLLFLQVVRPFLDCLEGVDLGDTA